MPANPAQLDATEYDPDISCGQKEVFGIRYIGLHWYAGVRNGILIRKLNILLLHQNDVILLSSQI
jgi:hypothetical protein